jgi:hypothetical protein
VVSFTPRPLYSLGKSPRYPLYRRVGGPQSQSGQRGEETFLTLPGLELRPLGRPACSQLLVNGVYVEDRVQEFLICDLDCLQFIDAEVKMSLACTARKHAVYQARMRRSRM